MRHSRLFHGQDLVVTWTGGGPNDVVVVYGLSITGSVPNGMVGQFICSANASDGQFTVPADVTATFQRRIGRWRGRARGLR
jgi:hypothetical protein